MYVLGLYISKIRGAIFWMVIKKILLIQFNPSLISGNQKWKGAAPNFVSNEIFKRFVVKFLRIVKLKEWVIEKSKIIEAMAWVIKYFKQASAGKIFLWLLKRGIILNKLISNPIHILNQE